MGFIPETVTRRLPSSVVGTLGVDHSGEQLGQAIAAGGEKVFNALAAKAAERKRTLDIISAQAKIRQYETDLDGISSVNKNNFKDNPQGGVDKTLEDGETLLNSTLEGIQDQNVRAMVAQGTTGSLRRGGNTMRGWAHQQEVINGARDLSSISNADAVKLSKDPNVDQMEEMLIGLATREDQFKAIYGKAWPKAMKQEAQSIFKGQLSGLESTDPITGLRFLKEYDFQGVFDADEMDKFKENMEGSITGWNKTLKLQSSLEVLNSSDAIHQAQLKGELTPALIDQQEIILEDQGLMTPEVQAYMDSVRKVAAENTDIDSVHSTNTWNALNDELRSLAISSDKTESDAKLGALFNFRARVWKASANRNILPKERRSFLNQTQTPTLEQIEDDSERVGGGVLGFVTFGYYGKPTTPEGAAVDKVNDWLEAMNFSDERSSVIKAQILSEVYTVLGDSRENGTGVTNEDAELLVESYFVDELAKQNPALQHIPPDGKSFRNPITGERFTIMPNGAKVQIK